MSELLDNITRAVERTVNCTVIHRESVPVVETVRGQPVWEGVVEVFEVSKPPPSTAYGWTVESDKGPQYVGVLGAPFTKTPLDAVRVWLVTRARK